jgi:hypothetical protein
MRANGEHSENLNKGDHCGGLKRVGSSQEIKGRYIKGRKNADKKISRIYGPQLGVVPDFPFMDHVPTCKKLIYPRCQWGALNQFTKPP